MSSLVLTFGRHIVSILLRPSLYIEPAHFSETSLSTIRLHGTTAHSGAAQIFSSRSPGLLCILNGAQYFRCSCWIVFLVTTVVPKSMKFFLDFWKMFGFILTWFGKILRNVEAINGKRLQQDWCRQRNSPEVLVVFETADFLSVTRVWTSCLEYPGYGNLPLIFFFKFAHCFLFLTAIYFPVLRIMLFVVVLMRNVLKNFP